MRIRRARLRVARELCDADDHRHVAGRFWCPGEADADDIRQSVTWSYVPFAVAGLLVIPVVLAYGGSPDAADPHDSVTAPAIATLTAVLITVVAIVWTLVLQVTTLAGVQRFSILRAIASMIILVIPLLLLAALT